MQCRTNEIPPELGRGDWPIDSLYHILVAWLGEEKARQRIEKSLKSFEKNLYRKYYIENGLFLLPLYTAEDPRSRELDHMIVIPKNPGDDPDVIFMKEAHKLGENAAGMADSMRQAIREGDENLIYLAGRSLFDSRFTQKDYSLHVSESKFGKKPYFYNIDQRNFFTKWKVEGGLGSTLQMGDTPYYLGGSLGAKGELDASWRQFSDLSGIKRKIIPTAKIGFWGKLADRTSFGLSALQNYNLYGDEDGPNQFFSTEFRLGVFHAAQNGSTVGALLHYKRSGEKVFSKDSQSGGLQASYSPPSEWMIFSAALELAEAEIEGKDKIDVRSYLSFVPKPPKEIDIKALAMETVGLKRTREGEIPIYSGEQWREYERKAEALLKKSRESLDFAGGLSRAPGSKEIELLDSVRFLRQLALKETHHMTIVLSSSAAIGVSPEALLSAAASMEVWEQIKRHPDAMAEGWSMAEQVEPKDGEEIARQIFKEAGYAGNPEDSARLQEILLIYASDLRRRLDHKALQAAFILKTLTDQRSKGAAGKSDIWEGRRVWNSITGMNSQRLKSLEEHFAAAAARLSEDFKLETRRYNLKMRRYGERVLKERTGVKDWPKSVTVAVREDAWVPLLADYGEDFFIAVLSKLKEAGSKLQTGEALPVEFSHLPVQSSPRVHRSKALYIQLTFAPTKNWESAMKGFWSNLGNNLPK